VIYVLKIKMNWIYQSEDTDESQTIYGEYPKIMDYWLIE